nr:hypothetical protein [uncultured Rhodopila sp.]
MIDISLEWDDDLNVGSNGDLALTSGADATNQRVYRRLLTNPGDYLWQLDYGGGLARFVGTPAKPADIESVVRTQLALESAVAASPAPQVSASLIDAANGYVVANITYFDVSSGSSVQLNVGSG